MPRQFIFQVSWRLRKKIADWLDKGKGNWWLRPLLRTKREKARRSEAVWPQPRRIKRHRFPTWLRQQGPYWFLPPLRRAKLKARWVAIWPQPKRPPRKHRFPAWLVQQGPYWISNLRLRRKQRRDRTFLPPLPRRAPARQHRFPLWPFQRGPSWRRKKKPVPQPLPQPHRGRRKTAGWLATLPPAVSYVPHRRKRRQVTAAAVKRVHRKIAGWLDPGKGAWWLKPLAAKIRQRARGYAAWPTPQRKPTRLRRFPAWLVQQGAYWTHRRKQRRAPSWPLAQRRHRKLAGWLVPPSATAYTPHRRPHRRFAAFPLPRGRFPHHRGATWIPAGFSPPPHVYTPKRRVHDRRWLIKPRPHRHAQKNIVWIARTQPGMAPVWWITRQGVAGEATSVSIGIGPNVTHQTRLRAMYLVVSGSSAGQATAVVRDGPANGGTIIFEADLYTQANGWDFLDFNGIDLRASAGNVLTVEFVAGTPGDVQEVNAEGDYVAPGTLYGVDDPSDKTGLFSGFFGT